MNIFWFRRDLRLSDNTGLHHALKEDRPVQPVFIFDTDILDELEDRRDRRVSFIHQVLHTLQEKLTAHGATLDVRYGRPLEVFEKLLSDYPVTSVFTNRDYEPYAIARDSRVEKLLRERGVGFYAFKDHVVFEKDEIVKVDGSPYTVFTPYARKWRSALSTVQLHSFPLPARSANFLKQEKIPLPSLEEIGFGESNDAFPPAEIEEARIRDYHLYRDTPSMQGTSRLGVHLRFGTVSIRDLVLRAATLNEKFLSELIWREFYQVILWHFPRVVDQAFKPAYDRIEWRNNEAEFAAWCDGKTGYPLVDAGMRELNATGFMHNRVRMVTASFLSKHLLIDWRWGEAYFAAKLLDYELASNNGGWQWAAGTGCDAAPYFRIFSPERQAKKFDPDNKYIHTWLPELRNGEAPDPIVEHAFACERCLRVYKAALIR